jgi:hypothetical protein
MVDQEILIREKLISMGFDLAVNDRMYFIKNLPGKSFSTLDEIANWIMDYEANERRELKEFRDNFKVMGKPVNLPAYTESLKKDFFDYIKTKRLEDDMGYLEEVFSESSFLYDATFNFCIENILRNINVKKGYTGSLCEEMENFIMGYYNKEAFRMNDFLNDDNVWLCDGYSPCQYWNELMDHITVAELKDLILTMKKRQSAA